MITKLLFGLQDGKLKSIEEVSSGLACDCTCPACKARLVAKKGDERIHHFAHYDTIECKGGIETALHLAAKQVLEEQKQIMLPTLNAYHRETGDITLAESQWICFDKIQSEVLYDNIKPDIVTWVRNKQLFIEVAVTHFVDQQKYDKIKSTGISTIEIDLSSLSDGFSKEELVQVVLDSAYHKKWIYNAREKELLQSFLDEKRKEQRESERRQWEQRKSAKDKELLYKRKGYDVLRVEEALDVLCPMLVQQNAYNFKSNEVILKLRKGVHWNGKIYGRPGNSRYIFLGKQKVEILPPDSVKVSVEQAKELRRLYGQLGRIEAQAIVDLYDTCEKCKYFVDHVDEKDFTFACKYRKSHNMK